jgi:hypothetical protein
MSTAYSNIGKGHKIGEYSNEAAVVASVYESITGIEDFSISGNIVTFIYKGEDLVSQTYSITLPDNVLTSLVLVGSTLTYTDELGNTNSILLDSIVKLNETVTTLTDNLDGTFTYLNEAGISNTIAYRDVFVYTDNTAFPAAGAENKIYIDSTNKLAYFYNITTNAYELLGGSSQTITTLVDNGDGTFTYTSEDATATTVTYRDVFSFTDATAFPTTGVENAFYIDTTNGVGYYWNVNTAAYTPLGDNEVQCFDANSQFPTVGTDCVIYVDKSTNKSYRYDANLAQTNPDGTPVTDMDGNPIYGAYVRLDKEFGVAYGSLNVLYGNNNTSFTATDSNLSVGVEGQIYVDTATHKTYMWDTTVQSTDSSGQPIQNMDGSFQMGAYVRLDDEAGKIYVVYGNYDSVGNVFNPSNPTDTVAVEGQIYVDITTNKTYRYEVAFASYFRLDDESKDEVVYGFLSSESTFTAIDPSLGETTEVEGKIYVDTNTNKTYRYEISFGKYVRLDNENSVVFATYDSATNSFTDSLGNPIVLEDGKIYVDSVTGKSYYNFSSSPSRLDNEVVYGTINGITFTPDFLLEPIDKEGKIYVDKVTGKSYKWTSADGYVQLDYDNKVVFSSDFSSFPDLTGVAADEKIYIAKDTNKSYYWNGTAYVRIDNEQEIYYGHYVSSTEFQDDSLIPLTPIAGNFYVDSVGFPPTNKTYFYNGTNFIRMDEESGVVFVDDITTLTSGTVGSFYIDKATNKSYYWDGDYFVRVDKETETLTTFDLTFDCSTFVATATYKDEAGTTNTKTIDLSCMVGGLKVPVSSLTSFYTLYTPCSIILNDGTTYDFPTIADYPLYLKTGTTLPLSYGDRLYNADGTLNMDIRSIGQGPQWIDPNVMPPVLEAENFLLYPHQYYAKNVNYGVIGKLNGSGC